MLSAFIIWSILGLFFVAMGIYDYHAKSPKPFGFWANAKPNPVKDVRGYNKALGKLWIVFGVLFILIGIPLLQAGQNSPWLVMPIVGCMFLSIGAMIVYVVVIEPKYRADSK